MNKFISSLLALLCFSTIHSQTFTWLNGSNTTNQPGVYGTKGVSSTTNIPGARSNAMTWTDLQGELWLFGGYGYDKYGIAGTLNDLWKYTRSSNSWAWMSGDSMRNKASVYGTQGIAGPLNKPGGRYLAQTWVDNSGNLWLFGGVTWSDVWKFDILSNQWTWVTGSQTSNAPATYGTLGTPSAFTTPGARYSPSFGSDAAGNLWLFGGNNCLGDLWKFTVSTAQWTWIAGTSSTMITPVYGTLGVSSPTVRPGGRMAGCLWVQNGLLYLFGGNGVDANNSSTSTAYLNDMWIYNFSNSEWMWTKGSNIGNQYAVPGTQETFSVTNSVGTRVGSVHWKDSQGNFWIFGGMGHTTSSAGYMNDIWKYNPTLNQWAWMQGNQSNNINGTYGTMGVPSIFNYPGSRMEPQGWMDNNNHIYVFGGYGFPQTGSWGSLNDLWLYKNCSSNTITVSTAPATICSGSTATLTPSGASSYSWSVPQSGNSVVVTPTNTTVYNVTTSFTNGCTKSIPVTVTVAPAPQLTLTASNQNVCVGEQVTIMAAGASSYSWSNNNQTNNVTFTPTSNTTHVFSVTGTGQNGCSALSSISITVALCTSLAQEQQIDFSGQVFPNPAKKFFEVRTTGLSKFIMVDQLGKEVINCTVDGHKEFVDLSLAPGVYHFRISSMESDLVKSGKLVLQ